jgi:imidazolonepropionase
VPKADLLLLDAEQVVTVDDGRPGPLRGPAQSNVHAIERGGVAILEGKIVDVGPSEDIRRRYPDARARLLPGRTLLPGFVDSHTHPVFATMRENEFAMRCRGATYEEILAAGGGILASARALREMPEETLLSLLLGRLRGMLAHGTTAAEAKSGYGLTVESEVRSLRVVQAAAKAQPVTLVATLLGAHALPQEYRDDRDAYVQQVADEMIPAVAKAGLARFCDVFVEKGAFTVEEGRRILRAGLAHGLLPKVHADQLRDGGGALLAAEVGALSAEHLGATGAEGIAALAKAGVVAVLLPSSCLFLNLHFRPNARAMITAGVPVAIATDFNPGSSPTESLGLAASLACATLGMTPEEAIVGITRNGAAACGLDEEHGRIARGRRANLVVLGAPSYTFLPYRMGTNLVREVYVDGAVVVTS